MSLMRHRANNVFTSPGNLTMFYRPSIWMQIMFLLAFKGVENVNTWVSNYDNYNSLQGSNTIIIYSVSIFSSPKTTSLGSFLKSMVKRDTSLSMLIGHGVFGIELLQDMHGKICLQNLWSVKEKAGIKASPWWNQFQVWRRKKCKGYQSQPSK